MNLYEQQPIEPAQDLAGHGRVRRRSCCCSASGSTSSTSAPAAAYVPIGSMIALGVGSVSAVVELLLRRPRRARRHRGAAGRGAGRGGDRGRRRSKLRQLENVVDEMAIASGLPRPHGLRRARRGSECVRDRPRSRRTRRSPSRAGCSTRSNREELQGVVAHEMSHIRNLDVRRDDDRRRAGRRGRAAADWARRGMMWGGGPRRRDRTSDDGRRRRSPVSSFSWSGWSRSCSRRCWRSCSR